VICIYRGFGYKDNVLLSLWLHEEMYQFRQLAVCSTLVDTHIGIHVLRAYSSDPSSLYTLLICQKLSC